jgi:hypothetical protein
MNENDPIVNAMLNTMQELLKTELDKLPEYHITTYFSGIPKPGDLYDSPSYRENFDASQGQVKDYGTGQSWVAFWYRENDFLKHNEQIMEDAEALGLFGK